MIRKTKALVVISISKEFSIRIEDLEVVAEDEYDTDYNFEKIGLPHLESLGGGNSGYGFYNPKEPFKLLVDVLEFQNYTGLEEAAKSGKFYWIYYDELNYPMAFSIGKKLTVCNFLFSLSKKEVREMTMHRLRLKGTQWIATK
jgi:hypothetical protein